MLQLFTGAFISFIITWFLLPVLIRFAEGRKLFVVRHYRNVHSKDVSSLGGIAIFTAVLFVILFFSERGFEEIKYYIAAAAFIFLVGLRDDLQEVKPAGKLFGQLVAAFLIAVPAKMNIGNLGGFFGIYELSYPLSVILTMLVIIWIINAYNFFDGIDMQAALFAIVIFAPSAFWFYRAAQYNFSLMLFATAASILAFLNFNKTPSKIFMGDTGTVTIGFIMAFAFVKFVKLNALNPSGFHNAFFMGLTFVQLPLVDSLRVVLIRILRGRSPFVADKNHFHHLLLRLGWSHYKISFFTSAYSLLAMALNFYFFSFRYRTSLIVLVNILILGLLYFWVYFTLKKRNGAAVK